MKRASNLAGSFAAGVVLAASLASLQADDIRPPDPSKGQINGKKAMLVWPVSGVEIAGDGARPQALLSPEGCVTRLAPVSDPEREAVYPCGEWFQPPEGTYRVWLEGPDLSTVGYGVVTYEAEAFTGRGMAMMMPLEPAGRVALSNEIPLQPSMSFRLLQIRGPVNGVLRGPFDRRVKSDVARAGVLMGTGTVLAGIFDRKSNDAIAIARPLKVTQGKTVYAAPALPVRGTDVFVTLQRPRVARPGEDEVTLALDVAGAPRKPDLFMNTGTSVFAVWYGVEANAAASRVREAALRQQRSGAAAEVGAHGSRQARDASVGRRLGRCAREPETLHRSATRRRRRATAERATR